MDNQTWGIITILLSFAGYLLAWKYQRQDQYVLAVFLLVLSGFMLRFFSSADFFLHEWDERYHALVARNMMDHPFKPMLYADPLLPYDYREWIGNHIWLHKQPMPFWVMATSMHIFGINEIALRLPSVLLTSTGIWLTYSIGKYLFSRRVAFLAAFLYSVNGLIIELSAGRTAVDHIDVFFLFFIELAVFFSIQFIRKHNAWYNVLAGLSLGAAILTKWLPALVVLPVWVLLVIDGARLNKKQIILQFLVLIGVCVLVFLPWQVYIHMAFPREAAWESQFMIRHLGEPVEGRGGPFYFYLDHIRINYGELIYLPLIWFLWKTVRDPGNYRLLAISIWIWVPLVFFSLVSTKMQAYILFTAPALFIITADFFHMLAGYRKHPRFGWLVYVVLVLIIVLPARYCIERVKPFDRMERNPQWVRQLRELEVSDPSKTVMFNYPRPVEAMFYTGMTVYPAVPPPETIREIQDKGYRVLINDGELGDNILPEIGDVRIVSLDTP